MKNTKPIKLITVSIPKELFEKIESKRWDRRLNRSQYVTTAIEDYFKREEIEKKNQ